MYQMEGTFPKQKLTQQVYLKPSPLVPIFFLIYINDLQLLDTDTDTETQIKLLGDDTYGKCCMMTRKIFW